MTRFGIHNTLSCPIVWGMVWRGQKRGCGETSEEAFAVVQEEMMAAWTGMVTVEMENGG